MTEVVIVGAGLGGLAAALFAARRGHSVMVLERDAPPRPDASADEDFLDWDRPGVAHRGQGHAFLALSTRVLRQEAPDAIAAILARGAMEVPIEPGSTETNLLSRRMVYEAVLRRIVENEPGVTVRSGVVVAGLRTRGDHAGVPRVSGVHTVSGEVVAAELVVDATGRNSRVARWLTAIGARPPVELAQPCGFSYLTRHFQLRAGHAFPATKVPIVAELDYATALAFPGDNGRFQLSTTVAARDPFRHQLREVAVYQRFLESVPVMRPWLDCGVPTDEPRPMAGIENRWCRLVDAAGPVVCGFVLLADAAVRTNPTFGRGVSLAFRHAQGLARVLDQANSDPVGWAAGFDEWTARALGSWFELQLATDTVRMRQLELGQRGERAHAASDTTSRFVAAMAIMREDDAEIRSVADRMYNLLMTPQDLLSDRALARRILAFLRTHPDAAPPRVGPDRGEFERLAGSRR